MNLTEHLFRCYIFQKSVSQVADVSIIAAHRVDWLLRNLLTGRLFYNFVFKATNAWAKAHKRSVTLCFFADSLFVEPLFPLRTDLVTVIEYNKIQLIRRRKKLKFLSASVRIHIFYYFVLVLAVEPILIDWNLLQFRNSAFILTQASGSELFFLIFISTEAI